MFCTLRSIDIVVREPEGEVAVQTDHRTRGQVDADWPVSVLLATARAVNPGRLAGLPRVRFVLVDSPSSRYRELLRALGAEVWVGLDGERWGPTPDPALVSREVAEALGALGRAVASRARPDQGRLAVERLQAEYAGRVADRDPDGVEFWRASIELTAAIGELLRAEGRDGRWVADPASHSLVPWVWDTGHSLANVFDKVERFFTNGPSEAPARLWWLLTSEVPGEQGTLLLRLRPPGWRAGAAMDLLPGASAPVVSVVIDRSHSVATLDAPDDALRDEAARNLAGIDVSLAQLDGVEQVLVVHGHEYAAEKLLDPPFLDDLADRLSATVLACATPARGQLWVLGLDERTDDRALKAFATTVARVHDDAEPHERIAPAVLLVERGRVVGATPTSVALDV